MPGYGGILSGLVQGYSGAIVDNENRQHEEKQKARQTEIQNYNNVMADAMAKGNIATAQWAADKINEVTHPSGKQQKENPLRNLLNLVGLGKGGQQPPQPGQQPQQGAPAPQTSARPVNPPGAAPTPPAQGQPGMPAQAGLPVSTTPVVRPQLTPPLPPRQQGAVDPNMSAAAQPGQQGGQGQQRALPPNLGDVMGQDRASADARAKASTDAAEAGKLDLFTKEQAIRAANAEKAEKQKHEDAVALQAAKDANKVTVGKKEAQIPGGKPWEYGIPVYHPDGTTTYQPAEPPPAVLKTYLKAQAMTPKGGDVEATFWNLEAADAVADQKAKDLKSKDIESRDKHREFMEGQSQKKTDAQIENIHSQIAKRGAGGKGGGKSEEIETAHKQAWATASAQLREDMQNAGKNKALQQKAQETYRKNGQKIEAAYAKSVSKASGNVITPPLPPRNGASNGAQAHPSGHQVGDPVILKNGKKVTITKINSDGTFDYK